MSYNLLISGANRGIGLEFVRQYVESGWRIFACCRDPQKAGELQKLAAGHANNLTVHTLDVGNSAQIRHLANALGSEQIDLLINNAGIYLHDQADGDDRIDEQALMESYRINSIAPLVMAQAFKQNLARSSYRKIANITSKMGSIADNSSGGAYAYRSSKAALNMLTKSLAIDLAPHSIPAIVLHPGWVQTDMGGSNAMITVARSVTGMRKVIDGIKIEDSGKFYGYDGKEIPW